MKKPLLISFYPLDVKKDEEEPNGLWFYLPSWLVRAYKLKTIGNGNMGRIKFVVCAKNRAMIEYLGEEQGMKNYWEKNWCKKIKKEERKKRLFSEGGK